MANTDENIADWEIPKTKTNYKDTPTIISAMADVVSSYYESLGENAAKLFVCEEEGKTFGWKIDMQGIRLVECGCYTEALWPSILSLALGPVMESIGTAVGKKIIREINERLMKKYIIATRKVFTDLFKEIEDGLRAASIRTIDRAAIQANFVDMAFGTDSDGNPISHIKNFAARFAHVDKCFAKLDDAKKIMTSDEYIRTYLDLYALQDPNIPNIYKLSISHYDIPMDMLNEPINALRDSISAISLSLLDIFNTFGPKNSFGLPLPIDMIEISDPTMAQFAKDFTLTRGSKFFAVLEEFLYNNPNSKFLHNNQLDSIIKKVSGLSAFLFGVLSYCTVVIDKECSPLIGVSDELFKSVYNGPTDHRISSGMQSRLLQIIDAIYFQGLWKGGSWDGSLFYPTFKSNNCKIDPSIAEALGDDPSWSDIQRVLVEKKLPVWPEMTTNCECSRCPAGYQLCSYSSIINGFSDVYNICLPVCGGQGVQPVQIHNVVTKANCDTKCPDGYMWVSCASSDCDKSVCRDGSDLGYCVKIPDDLLLLKNNNINIRYGKVFWDATKCKWVCYSGRWVMDWIESDGPESIGPVYPDDVRFNKKIYIPASGPGGMGYYTSAYQFRADRYVRYSPECDEPSVRDPDNNCECSGSYGDVGIPEVPEGYIFFDNKVIPIVETE